MSVIAVNLAAIAVVVAGWTAAVAVFYKRLSDSPAQPRTTAGHQVIEFPGTETQPEPVLAGQRAA